jgi:DNA-binding ferritin-like protein
MNEIALILRSLQLAAHNFHNLANGEGFFSDHEFLGSLYGEYEAAYDSIVERILGLGQSINLVGLQSDAAEMLAEMGADNPWQTLLDGEKKLCKELDAASAPQGGVSPGTANLLAQLYDDSEVRQYKLQQRLQQKANI